MDYTLGVLGEGCKQGSSYSWMLGPGSREAMAVMPGMGSVRSGKASGELQPRRQATHTDDRASALAQRGVDGCRARKIGLQAACPERSGLRQGTRRWCLHIPAFYSTELRGLDWNFEVHLTQSPLCNRWNPKKSSSLPKFLQLITKLE